MLIPQPLGQGVFLGIRSRGVLLTGLGVDQLALVVDLVGDYAAGALPPVHRLRVNCATWIPGPVPAVTLHPKVFFP